MCQNLLSRNTVNDQANSTPNITPNKPSSLKVLLCSENVPPQVNGIARRIGQYDEGLRKLGCEVTLIQPEMGHDKVIPHTNPWNFTARMMMLRPSYFWSLLNTTQEFDVVHAVMPLNLSGIWLLAACKFLRLFRKEQKSPALVISWHCNMVDYAHHHSQHHVVRELSRFVLFAFASILPQISDRILTPTKMTDPEIVQLWNGRAGVCHTGIRKDQFSPANKDSTWGKYWGKEKEQFLKETNCKYLLVCIGRLSVEKGVDELIKTLPLMDQCALWLVGDGLERSQFETLARELKVPVKFLGYQNGDALHAAYAIADCFVCPSLTETFGQTVNEALASQVRVAMPRVPVFVEAYSDFVPNDAYWTPLDRNAMAQTILTQLKRSDDNAVYGIPDPNKIMDWDDACYALVEQYETAKDDIHNPNRNNLSYSAMIILPIWYMLTFALAIVVFYLSYVRTLAGGSVRKFLIVSCIQIVKKLKNIKDHIINI